MALTILVGGYTSMITALTFTAGLSGGTGTLSTLSQSPAGTNPSWIALNPRNSSILYAGQENYNGQILSFLIDHNTAKLTQVGTVGTGGQNPAFFLPLFAGTEIIAANYNSGTTGDILLGADRSQLPSSPASTIQLTGSGPNSSRQTSPHPHEVIEYIINQELLVSDLGSDKVWRLNRAPSTGNWQVADFVQQPSGSGPRHMAVSGNNLYVVHELSNTLTQQTLPVLGSGQASQFISTQSIIPPGASNTTLAAGELMISTVNCMYPKEYLYATNRNDPNSAGDAISIFSTNPLTLVAQVRTGLQGLRGAALGGPNGEYLVVGGQTSGGVVLYQRTNGGASLTELGRISSVSQPSSFVILPNGQSASLFSKSIAFDGRVLVISTTNCKMARNEEKAQSMLFRFREAQAAELGMSSKGARRPKVASSVKSLKECERWRGELLREISRKVSKIQDAGMSDYEVRDLNDEINKLMREKRHWENQIIAMGGVNFRRNMAMIDEDGKEVPGTRGYKYFGRAKDLPGVRELFKRSTEVPEEELSLAWYKKFLDQGPAYYGDLDEADESLLQFEKEAEEEEWKDAYKSLAEKLGLPPPDDKDIPRIPRPDPVSLAANGTQHAPGGVDGDGDQSMTKENGHADGNFHPPSLAFLSPEEIAPPKMPTKEELESVLLEIRKKAILEEYLGPGHSTG